VAKQLGIQDERPVKLPRKKVPHAIVTAAVITTDGKVLLAQRPSQGLLGGLWEFPGGTLEKTDQDLEACLLREIKEELGVRVKIDQPYGVYRHAYTHFRITLHAFLCRLPDGQIPQAIASEAVTWVFPSELSSFPMGKVDRQIANRLVEEVGDGFLPG
jgi:A/G-specific adenine glycosylase